MTAYPAQQGIASIPRQRRRPPDRKDLTAEFVRSLFTYDPETGELRSKVARGPRKVGSLVGSAKGNGYRQVEIGGHNYLVHRIIWLHHTGSWPVEQVDHVNNDPSDNRWVNLREADISEQQQNLAGPRSNNKAGTLGVHYSTRDKRWIAQLAVSGRTRFAGYYGTREEAEAAYKEAKAAYHPRGKR